jgi:hypothetical protein
MQQQHFLLEDRSRTKSEKNLIFFRSPCQANSALFPLVLCLDKEWRTVVYNHRHSYIFFIKYHFSNHGRKGGSDEYKYIEKYNAHDFSSAVFRILLGNIQSDTG